MVVLKNEKRRSDEHQDDFLSYFEYSEDFPQDVLVNLLPLNILWCY